MGIHFNGGGNGGGNSRPARKTPIDLYGNMIEVVGPSGKILLVPRQFAKPASQSAQAASSANAEIGRGSGNAGRSIIPSVSPAPTMQLITRPDGSVVMAPSFANEKKTNTPKPDKVKKPPQTVGDLFIGGYRPAQGPQPYTQSPSDVISSQRKQHGYIDASQGWNQLNHVVNSNSGGPMTWGTLDAPDPYAQVRLMASPPSEYGYGPPAQPTPFSDVRQGVLSDLAKQPQPPPATSDYIDPAALARYNQGR